MKFRNFFNWALRGKSNGIIVTNSIHEITEVKDYLGYIILKFIVFD